jgi:hypothetical protein
MALTKAVTDTSQQALDFVAPALPEREALVLEGLQTYYDRHGFTWPTARELLEAMKKADVLPATADVNAVRPRLSELYEAGRVLKVGKRKCTIGGKVCELWRPTPPDQVEAAHQIALAKREDLRRR